MYKFKRGVRCMAAYTTHSEERRAEREIKQAYIELCLSKGTRRNVPSTPSPFHSGPFIHKHHYMGLIVLSVPNTHPPTVITAYWTSKVKEDFDRCIARFDQRLCVNKKRLRRRRRLWRRLWIRSLSAQWSCSGLKTTPAGEEASCRKKTKKPCNFHRAV